MAEKFYQEDFLKAARQHREARVYKRLLGMHQIQRGESMAQVGEKLGVHWRSVQNWVRRYHVGGGAGLAHQPGQGRKRRLKVRFAQAFKSRLIAYQKTKGGGWLTGRDGQKLLKRWFSITYSSGSREETDEVAPAAFKKTSKLLSNRSSHPRYP